MLSEQVQFQSVEVSTKRLCSFLLSAVFRSVSCCRVIRDYQRVIFTYDQIHFQTSGGSLARCIDVHWQVLHQTEVDSRVSVDALLCPDASKSITIHPVFCSQRSQKNLQVLAYCVATPDLCSSFSALKRRMNLPVVRRSPDTSGVFACRTAISQ